MYLTSLQKPGVRSLVACGEPEELFFRARHTSRGQGAEQEARQNGTPGALESTHQQTKEGTLESSAATYS